MSRSRIVTQWVQIALGLLVFSFGVHLTIFANIGLAPWDCLGMGVAAHTPFNYGVVMTCMSVAILLIDLALKERIGYGTIIDALLTGNFVQAFNDHTPITPCSNLWTGIAMMLVGFVFMAVGMWIYMSGEQCWGRAMPCSSAWASVCRSSATRLGWSLSVPGRACGKGQPHVMGR